jgi:hypothetical protein
MIIILITYVKLLPYKLEHSLHTLKTFQAPYRRPIAKAKTLINK